MGDDAWLMMGSYPHAIKLVQKDPYDDYQGGMYYLTWWESYNRKFVLANIPSANMIGEEFAVYVTDGVVERVIVDTELSIGDTYSTYNTNYADQEYEAGDNWKHGGIAELGGHDGPPDERVTAYFSKASNILYTSYDTAYETAYFAVEPCLDKGDMLFIINSYYMAGRYDPGDTSAVAKSPDGVLLTNLDGADPPTANFESGNLYTIKKIYKEDPTTSTWDREDRFRIILDKNIPFEASEKVQFQETNATNGWLSNRGICDEGSCECFKGYTDDNCDIQSSLAV